MISRQNSRRADVELLPLGYLAQWLGGITDGLIVFAMLSSHWRLKDAVCLQERMSSIYSLLSISKRLDGKSSRQPSAHVKNSSSHPDVSLSKAQQSYPISGNYSSTTDYAKSTVELLDDGQMQMSCFKSEQATIAEPTPTCRSLPTAMDSIAGTRARISNVVLQGGMSNHRRTHHNLALTSFSHGIHLRNPSRIFTPSSIDCDNLTMRYH